MRDRKRENVAVCRLADNRGSRPGAPGRRGGNCPDAGRVDTNSPERPRSLTFVPSHQTTDKTGVFMRGWISFLLLQCAAVTSALAAGFSVIESDETHVRVAFELGAYELVPGALEGYVDIESGHIARTREEGRPRLPVFTTVIGLPANTLARVRVLETDLAEIDGVRVTPFPSERFLPADDPAGMPTPVQSFDPDLATYDRSDLYPASVAMLGEAGNIRNQAVASVRVTPFRTRGGANPALVVTRRVVFEVRFEPDPTRRVAVTSVPSGGGDERFYRGRILNDEDARHWRHRRAQVVSPALRRHGRLGSAPEVKIRIDDNALVRVSHASLRAIGWTETPALSDLQMTSRSYDPAELDEVDGNPFLREPIGIRVTDVDSDGMFDADDFLVFYGRDASTQRNFTEAEARYGTENVYWLTVAPGEGSVMPSRSVAPSGTPDAEPTSFAHWTHHEENEHYYWYSFRDDDLIRLRQRVDHVLMSYWNLVFIDADEYGLRLPFDVHDPEPGTLFGFRAEYRGLFQNAKTYQTFIVIGDSPTDMGRPLDPTPRSFLGDTRQTYDSGGLTLRPEFIGSGRHQLVMTLTDPANMNMSVNWFETGYRRLYRMHDGYLDFTNDIATGHVRFQIGNVPTTNPADVVLLDTTNPDLPVSLFGFDIEAGAGNTLVFDDPSVGGRRDYVVQPVAGIPEIDDEALELDTPSSLSDLVSGALDADYLVVVHDAFAPGIDDLVQHRQSLGHRCEVANVSDVYDEFAGGLFTPEAIREYVRFAYRMRPAVGGVAPQYLLLVGDASEDYYGVSRIAGTGAFTAEPNYVPSFSVLGNVSDTGISKPFIQSDNWFIQDPDGVEDDDTFNSMMVGRLPAGSLAEAETMSEKIIRYETDLQASPESQEWRNRGLFFADDFYSGGLGGTGGTDGYTCKRSELEFVRTHEAAIDTIRAAGFTDFGIERFYLTDLIDRLPALGRDTSGFGTPGYPENCVTPGCDWACTRRHLRNDFNLDSLFVDTVNRGHLFVAFSGHGNRKVTAHEWVLIVNQFVSGGDGFAQDVNRLQNYARLPVWFFFACHLAEFGSRLEGQNGDGDCIAEQLLTKPEVGGVASVASSGFEWLSSNPPIERAVFSSWFSRPYLADEYTGYPGLTIGEIMLGTKNLLAAEGEGTLDGMVESYVTLGDPATRIDFAPPRLRVWQDAGDAPWDDLGAPDPVTSGSELVGPDADTRLRHFAAHVFDEAPIDSADVRVGERAGGVVDWLDPSEYTVTRRESGVDPLSGLVREWTFAYDAPLRADDYELVFEVSDFYGRPREVTLSSVVDVRFYEVVDGNEREIVPGSFIEPTAVIRARLDSPVGLGADEVDLTLNGDPMDAIKLPADDGIVAGAASFGWVVEAGLGSEVLNHGSNAIGLRWSTGSSERAESIEVQSVGAFSLERYFVFPNPFDRHTDVFYRVTRAARSASVKIYTLSGRLIRRLEQPDPVVDLNRIAWDGRDEDGDLVASGVYFYRLEIVKPDGARVVEQGKIARVAESN